MTDGPATPVGVDRTRPHSHIDRRFVVYVVLFSSLVTLVLTGIQLFLDYRTDRAAIDERLVEVRQVHLANIAQSLWVADFDSIKLQIEGIEKLTDMQYLAVLENDDVVISVGKLAVRNVVGREYPVQYSHLGEIRQIGTLMVQASLDGVYQRLLQKALVILISNAIKTFLVAGFMILFLRRFILTPLEEFTQFLRKHEGAVAVPEFKPASMRDRQDELAVVFQKFNELNKRLEHSFAAVRESEKRFREIAENVGDLFWIGSPDWQEVWYVNPAYEEMWGRSSEELLSSPTAWMDALDEQGRKDVERTVEQAQKAIAETPPGTVRHIDFPTYKVIRPDGSERMLYARGFPVWDDHSKLERIVGIATDVTELFEAQAELLASEERLRRAQKLESIGHMTGGVAHDFNNLLAVILGNLELLRDDITETEDLELIEAAMDAVGRGGDLTQNMLSFARQAALTPKVLDLNEIVHSTQSWIGRTLPATVHVETSLQADLSRIEADAGSTQSALLNLVINARDAMQNDGNLTIETANILIRPDDTTSVEGGLEPGEYVMLAVSDTGEGIPKEALETVFEPFYTTKPPGSGSGLGLSMIQGFMDQSGGTTRIYSEPGVGTTVKLFFRALPNEHDRAPDNATVDAQSAGGTERILLVEDQAAVLEILLATLEKAGYEVKTATTGDEAKNIFLDEPAFDLLVTDIVMPGELQGTTLAKALRELRPDLPVVFMSGYASEATVHGNGLRPEDIRLMKPVHRVDLLSAIEKALQRFD
jgi:PAS domain S-box-containing protein